AARARMIAAEIAADEAAEPRRSHASRKLDELIELGAAAPASLAALVGNPDTAHVRLAQGIRRALPEEIAAAGRHPDSARALLLALALDAAAEPRSRQR